MRNISLCEGEFYHVYNRGVDKRVVFEDEDDMGRFFQGMEEFNVKEPIGSLYENSFHKATTQTETDPLVRFIAYCLNPNHYHFILEQISEKGIEKFMHRLGTSHTKYFNEKNKRSGSLFQGKFKAKHIDSNTYLLHLSAYINLNYDAHQLGSRASKLVRSRSSWEEYLGKHSGERFCHPDIVLGQFKNPEEYATFAQSSLEMILKRKEEKREFEDYFDLLGSSASKLQP